MGCCLKRTGDLGFAVIHPRFVENNLTARRLKRERYVNLRTFQGRQNGEARFSGGTNSSRKPPPPAPVSLPPTAPAARALS